MWNVETEQLMAQLQKMHLDICEIKTSITGGLDGKPGIIGRVTAIENDTCLLKAWRNRQNRFVMKLVFAAIGSGGVFGAILKIIHWI